MCKDKSIYACYEEIKQREISELKEKLKAFGSEAHFGPDYTGKGETGKDFPFVLCNFDYGPVDMKIMAVRLKDDELQILGYDTDAGQYVNISLDNIAYGHISFISDNIPVRLFTDKSFSISRLSREDLEQKGFDTSDVDDATMQRLAEKLGDDYCSQLFWDSLEIIAECMDIPRKEGWSEEDDDDDE
jgi:hypothetical protein